MNIIEKVKAILLEFPKIKEVCNTIHVDFAETEPMSYGLSSLGDELIKEDVLGNQRRSHSFMLYATFSAINDYERMHNSGALLELTHYLDSIEGEKVQHIIDGETREGEIVKLTATNGMLFSVPEENLITGIQYQLTIKAEYTINT